MREMVFTPGAWASVQAAIFSRPGREGFAFGLAQAFRGHHGLRYVVSEVLRVPERDFDHRGAGGVSLSADASDRLNALSASAAGLGALPVHIHSHPAGVPGFSAVDDAHEATLHAYLCGHGQAGLLSVVQAVGAAPRARLWLNGVPHPARVRVGLHGIGALGDTAERLPALERQAVFGDGLRRAAASLHVAIVGLGGLGMLVAEQLARAGFRRFTLVDPDLVEPTNLNRLPACVQDLGRPKVHLARRLIRIAGRGLGIQPEVETCRADIYLAARHVQRSVERSDLVLALTDNELSRIELLRLAQRCGAEYLMAGTDIALDSMGRVTSCKVEVTGAERGAHCPVCEGRLDPAAASVEARLYSDSSVCSHAIANGYVTGVPAPAVMSLNSVAAGLLVGEIQRRVAGLPKRDYLRLDVQSGELIVIDQLGTDDSVDCGICGREARFVRRSVTQAPSHSEEVPALA